MLTATEFEMHKRFVDDIRRQIAEKRSELQRLEIVADFHASQINGYLNDASQDRGTSRAIRVFPAHEFTGKSLAEIAKWLLTTINRRMKTGEMARILHSSGYDRDADHRHLSNALYTAMNRQPTEFNNVNRGNWGLAIWGKGEPKSEREAREEKEE